MDSSVLLLGGRGIKGLNNNGKNRIKIKLKILSMAGLFVDRPHMF